MRLSKFFIPFICSVSGIVHAACSSDDGTRFLATAGDTCTAAQPTYTFSINVGGTIDARDVGTVLNITAPNITSTNPTGSGSPYALTTSTDAIINVSGNFTGNVNGLNGRVIAVFNPSTVNIAGDAILNHTGSQGAGIQLFGADANLTINGTTTVTATTGTTGADGMRLTGTSEFGGDVVVNVANYITGISASSESAQFLSNLTLTADSMRNGGLNNTGATVTVAGNLTIDTRNTVNDGDQVHAINATGGILTVNGMSTLTTESIDSHGIVLSGANTAVGLEDIASSIATQGDDAHGIFFSSTAGIVAIGQSATSLTGPIVANSGEIITNGANANGIDLSTATVGVTVDNNGAITSNNGFAILGSSQDDTVNLIAGTVTGDINLGDGSDTLNYTGGAINGQLNGGDGVSSADGMVDTLNYDGLTITAPDMMNWELTNVINGANVTFANDFETETLTTDSASTAVLADALTITGDVVNDGTINMQSGTATGTATIDGNLTGSGTLAISIDVGADIADVLTVTGDSTSASIAIHPNPISAVPATGNDVLVATVDGTTAAGDFTLPNGTTMQTINGVTYELVLVGNNWFLRANGTPTSNSPAAIPSTSVWALLAAMLVMMFAAMAAMVMTTTRTTATTARRFR
ncbi:beta strand repeat-containing protein [Ostreibacterium oceani]|uniref:Uncharacterized protein n=1 Tax=Ostreibacterium oceani TaxID=2654998 RepID=A0A6N7F1H8_9GAMM|nr:hypothetical protein [Ostreibacterium oceani]MPV86648.1 hypothetical protein [Ostreibacterium oceani]